MDQRRGKSQPNAKTPPPSGKRGPSVVFCMCAKSPKATPLVNTAPRFTSRAAEYLGPSRLSRRWLSVRVKSGRHNLHKLPCDEVGRDRWPYSKCKWRGGKSRATSEKKHAEWLHVSREEPQGSSPLSLQCVACCHLHRWVIGPGSNASSNLNTLIFGQGLPADNVRWASFRVTCCLRGDHE